MPLLPPPPHGYVTEPHQCFSGIAVGSDCPVPRSVTPKQEFGEKGKGLFI